MFQKAKPLNNFDIEESVLQFLNDLFNSKKCIIYVFGNPYVLQIIPNLKNALGICSSLSGFYRISKECAAKQLIENLDYKGVLPFKNKKFL